MEQTGPDAKGRNCGATIRPARLWLNPLRARGAKSSRAPGHSQGTQRSTVRRAGIPSDSVRLQNDTLVTVREHLNELCGDLGLILGLAGGCGWELFEQSHPTGVQLYTKDTEGHDNAIAFK